MKKSDLTKDEIRQLIKAKRYLIKERHPKFEQQSKYSNLFVEIGKKYNVSNQVIHDLFPMSEL